jgi:hypothetical protein
MNNSIKSDQKVGVLTIFIPEISEQVDLHVVKRLLGERKRYV